MDDGQGLFMFVLFVLWLLGGLADALKRRRMGEMGEGEGSEEAPTGVEAAPPPPGRIESAPGGARTTSPQRVEGRLPQEVLEQLEELARRGRTGAEGSGSAAEAGTEREAGSKRWPGGDRRPEHDRRPGAERQPRPERRPLPRGVPRPQGGPVPVSQRAPGARTLPVPTTAPGAPAAEERRSERWVAGTRAEVAAVEVGAAVSEEHRVARNFTREGRIDAAAAEAVRVSSLVPVVAPSALTDVRNLVGASRAELRRVLILQEVLGAPVALRRGHLEGEGR